MSVGPECNPSLLHTRAQRFHSDNTLFLNTQAHAPEPQEILSGISVVGYTQSPSGDRNQRGAHIGKKQSFQRTPLVRTKTGLFT